MLVLVAEDSYVTAQRIGSSLEEGGYSVRLASGAERALLAMAERRPAMVIVDLALSDGLTGPELARALGASGVPVIVCTGYDADLARARCCRASPSPPSSPNLSPPKTCRYNPTGIREVA